MRRVTVEEEARVRRLVDAMARALEQIRLGDAAQRVRRCDTGNLGCTMRAIRVADTATRMRYGSVPSPRTAVAVEVIALANAAATAILTTQEPPLGWLDALVERARARSEDR